MGRSVRILPIFGFVRILRQSASATICSARQRHGVIRSAHRLLIIDQISIELSTRSEALIARHDKISQQRAHEWVASAGSAIARLSDSASAVVLRVQVRANAHARQHRGHGAFGKQLRVERRSEGRWQVRRREVRRGGGARIPGVAVGVRTSPDGAWMELLQPMHVWLKTSCVDFTVWHCRARSRVDPCRLGASVARVEIEAQGRHTVIPQDLEWRRRVEPIIGRRVEAVRACVLFR